MNGLADGGWRMAATAACVALLACACGLPGKMTLDVSPKIALTGPKDVAIMGTRTDVVAALEGALAERGFTFKRYMNRDRQGDPAAQVRSGANVTDNTRYAVEVTPDIFDRCAAGGFQFKSLKVSVIDRQTNELMLRTSATGRSEKCPPTSGDIFHEIAKAIDTAWRK